MSLKKLIEKEKLTKEKKQQKRKGYPFFIHAPVLKCECEICGEETDRLFPYHTHGLHDIQMPEIFMDPRAFKKHIAGHLIQETFTYLKDNPKTLDLIRKGKTVVLNNYELVPKIKGTDEEGIHRFCLRLVNREFTGVKMAYPHETESDEFIQLYVEGDDFVLQDKYYEDGCPLMNLD